MVVSSPSPSTSKVVHRVLLIDDNRDAARALAMALRLLGHEVALAFTGAEGLEKARASSPDVIVCDIGLPGLDGYQVARTVRGDRSLAATTLVALTGHVSPEDVRRATEAGFDLHLRKPLSVEHLRRILEQLPARAG